MSAISIDSSKLYQFYQNVSASNATPQAAATTSTADDAQASGAPVQGSGHHHHHHHGSGGEFKKIEDAVTSALQSAQGDPSSDPNEVIQDAITKVLSGSSDNSSNPTSAAPGDANSTQSGDASSAAGGPQSFFQLLHSLGVDPQQFHQDFLTAVQNAQNGQVDAGSALKSFPPGSTVDTLG